jgi:four helix bundle protein
MELDDLEIYQLSRQISQECWFIYQRLDWQTKKITANQWIEAVDSVGANMAEGFGRFHYLDKNKFNYNARGSLIEAIHWTELLHQRCHINQTEFGSLRLKLSQLLRKLNAYIFVTKQQTKK